MAISMDAAKSLLDGGIKEAQNLIKDPYKVDELLIQLENKLREVPAIGEKLSDLPVMIAMVKSYITGEYRDVSPKVIVTMIAAFLYLVKGKEARINHPGTLGEHWKWRLAPNFLSGELSSSIYQLAKLYGRIPKAEKKDDEIKK